MIKYLLEDIYSGNYCQSSMNDSKEDTIEVYNMHKRHDGRIED